MNWKKKIDWSFVLFYIGHGGVFAYFTDMC